MSNRIGKPHIIAATIFACLVTGAWRPVGDGTGGGGDVIPIIKKCCKPATVTGPAGACPAPPCAATVTCTDLPTTGSWVDGGCQTATYGAKCNDTTTNTFKPIVNCRSVPCTQENGDPGVTCGWVQTGTSTDPQNGVKSCNGTVACH